MPVAKNGRTILLADDDLEVRSYLETVLRCQGFTVELAQDGEEVLECLRANPAAISAVIMEVIMPRRDGLEALREIRAFNPDIPVIMISAAVSALNVVEAMKLGASDFISKPINLEDFRKALASAFQNSPLPQSNTVQPTPAPASKQILFGVSSQMRDLQSLIGQVGWSEAPVLIQGETGTGKEVLARELHARSPRAKKTLLKLNCVALPSELVESELFGYERGAFTGAFEKKLGMFAQADGGTILLDEIGDMDFKLQAKLLQVLQDQEFQRIGGKDTIKVDVRVIAATHRDLEKAMEEGNFREDLYYRLNVVSLRVPPLRERQEDIGPLSEFLLRKHTPAGAVPLPLTPALKDLFAHYRWPGNVRELENMIRKFLVLRDPRLIEHELRHRISRLRGNGNGAADTKAAAAPPQAIGIVEPSTGEAVNPPAAAPVLEQVAKANREAERTAIIAALKLTNWNRKQAALMLEIDYKALLYKMNRLSIKKEKLPPRSMQRRPETSEAANQPVTPHGAAAPALARALG